MTNALAAKSARVVKVASVIGSASRVVTTIVRVRPAVNSVMANVVRVVNGTMIVRARRGQPLAQRVIVPSASRAQTVLRCAVNT